MRTAWQASVFLLVVIFISLIYKLPAKFVYQQFAAQNPVQLSGISGSIWSGHAEQLRFQSLTLKQLDWQLSPMTLLFGEVSLQWTLGDAAVSLAGDVTLSSSQLMIKNTQGNIDLLLLAQRLPPQNILLAGIVHININEINIQQKKLLNAKGNVDWQQAELLSPENIHFGGFNAHLTNDAGRLILKVNDTGGAVSLGGKIILSIQGVFQYSMNVAIRDTTELALLEGFNQLGQAEQDGSVTLKGNGSLF